MTTELTPKTCVGRNNHNLSANTNWYGFSNLPISKDTRCEYCFRHMKILELHRNMYELVNTGTPFDCDSMSDPVMMMLEAGGFRFQVTTQDRNTPFLIHPQSGASRREGLLIVEMPEKTKYAITINPQVKELNLNKNMYYSFEMKVGDRPVIINGGNPTYYRDLSTVHGFDVNNSFEFTAVDPTADTETLHENLITINVICYRRTNGQFIISHNIPVRIQLIYVNPEKYQVPQHSAIFANLTSEADAYLPRLEQQRRHEVARRIGILPTSLVNPVNSANPVTPPAQQQSGMPISSVMM